MRSSSILVVVLVVAAVAGYLTYRFLGASPAVAPAPPAEPASTEGDPAGGPPSEREVVRQKWQQMVKAIAEAGPARAITLSSAERREGEPEPIFLERQRAIAEYRKYVEDREVPPDRDLALRGLLADAQESWQLALKAAGRTQPIEPGSEVNDPVLSGIWTTIEDDFRGRVDELMPGLEAQMFRSFVPSILPYVRTRAFEVAR